MLNGRKSDITRRKYRTIYVIVIVIVFGALTLSSCSGTGACVGSGGGILLSPVCKDDWSKSECQEWDAEEVNGANWDFHGGKSCESLGYTDRCSDGSYRLPGDC